MHVKTALKYEQPLTERMRLWLRLEYLFECVSYYLKGSSSWDSRSAMSGLIDLLELMSRNEVRFELSRDLERQAQSLQRWQGQPEVNTERLRTLLHRVQHALRSLASTEQPIEQVFNEHYLVHLVRQRATIPGGACRFDIPAYYHWLNKSMKQRQADLQMWLTLFRPIQEAIKLYLFLLRQQATIKQEVASDGYYQARLDAQADFQLVRIVMPNNSLYYPEVSGSKHRISLRFLEYRESR